MDDIPSFDADRGPDVPISGGPRLPPDSASASGDVRIGRMDDRPQLGSGHDADSAAAESARHEREARLAALRAAVQRGIEDADAGRVVDLDEGIDQVLRSIREKKAAGRPG
jgi:predicted transcriptional regulator